MWTDREPHHTQGAGRLAWGSGTLLHYTPRKRPSQSKAQILITLHRSMNELLPIDSASGVQTVRPQYSRRNMCLYLCTHTHTTGPQALRVSRSAHGCCPVYPVSLKEDCSLTSQSTMHHNHNLKINSAYLHYIALHGHHTTDLPLGASVFSCVYSHTHPVLRSTCSRDV